MRNALEERVREHNVIQISTRGIVQHVFVDEEQQGHVDLFPGQQLLFFKTEAFDLGKIRRDLRQAAATNKNKNTFVTTFSTPLFLIQKVFFSKIDKMGGCSLDPV